MFTLSECLSSVPRMSNPPPPNALPKSNFQSHNGQFQNILRLTTDSVMMVQLCVDRREVQKAAVTAARRSLSGTFVTPTHIVGALSLWTCGSFCAGGFPPHPVYQQSK